MATVAELTPGDLVTCGEMSAVFISRDQHPTYGGFQMVTWKLADRTWSFDALVLWQEVGDVTPSTPADRYARLRGALLGEVPADGQ